MNRSTVVVVIAAVAAAVYAIFGLWPLFDSRSFFDEVATFEPYNAHFLHDIGSFQVGIAVALLAAIWRRGDALFAALSGAAVGTVLHAAAHVADHDLGGDDATTVFLWILAAALGIGAALRLAPARR